ncbi:MAG: hypothetical protein KDE51_09215, partial [Anaerolineales bacterium]|nr:hypothetical protein [Anaerolineales bacterium]
MFGYLVPLAAGSLALALSNWFDLATHWWVLSFTAVPLLLALASTYLTTPPHNLLQRPFRHLSLAFSVPVLIIESSIWILSPFSPPEFALALGLSWWLTTIILLLAIRPYPLQLTVLGALFAFPVGLWLNQSWFVQVYGWHWAWHAAGFAILTPLYIILGWWVKQKEQTWQFELKSFGFIKNHWVHVEKLSEMILAVAWLLALIAGGLSLGRVAVMVPVHTLLAASFLLIAILWQRPRVLWAMSFLLLTASAAWQGYRGASPVELTLPWALLAIIHVIAAVRLPDRHLAYRQVLNQAAVVLAAFALLPPIPLFDAAMMSYALLNWIGITGWLAYLYHAQSWSISTTRNHNTKPLNISLLLQWLAALPIMPWLLLVTRNESVALRTILIAGATWLLLALSLRLRKADWGYRRPWQMATHLNAFAVLGLAHTGEFEAPELLAMTAVAAFYFAAAPLYKNRWWLFFAALLVPYIITQRFFNVGANPYDLMIVLGLLTLVYISVGYLLQRTHTTDLAFLEPLFGATLLLTIPLLLVSGVAALATLVSARYGHGTELPKIALSVSAITAAYLLLAWVTNQQLWAHTAVWLFVYTGSLFVIAYSRGSGLSAFLVALLSFAYIFGERQLSHVARRKIDPLHNRYGAAWRKGWLLFRAPLQIAGWILSAVAILAALVRNLILLDAGTEQYLWSIATLLTITILHGLSAHWFKQVVFVYFSSLLWVTTWTVTTDLIHVSWLDMTRERWFGISWAVCAFTLLAAGLAITEKTPFFWRNFKQKEASPTLDKFSWAPQIVAHLLLPFALVANTKWLGSVAITFALAAVFYTFALLIDRRYRPVSEQWLGRFLYPAVVALILATLNGIRYAIYPAGSYTIDSIVLIAYAFPALWLGRYLSRLQPQYGLPLYLTSYGVTLLALAIAVPEQPLFTLYLFIAAAQTLLSAIWFKQPLWLYPMSFLLFIGTVSGLDWLEFAIHEVG